MISDAVLEQGVVRGIVTNQQVENLRTLAREMAAIAAPEPQDDEKLRFITGFNDIFVTIGIGLFATALIYLLESFIGTGGSALALAAASWLLAEFFTRRRRMALPSIALLCIFSGAIFYAGAIYLGDLFSMLGGRAAVQHSDAFAPIGLMPSEKKTIIIMLSAMVTAILTGAHYYRFRVPITVAVGVAALAGVLVAALFSIAPVFSEENIHIIAAITGLVVFALAMRFDLSDPERVTRRNDIAFWLHLLAAPLIVHPVISQFVGNDLLPQVGTAVAVLAMFMLLGAVAVVIDRRAMLVSGLAYAGYAFSSLIKQVGFEDQTMPATLLALGAFVLLLSAGWRPVRTALLRLLPAHLAQRLPHPILSSS